MQTGHYNLVNRAPAIMPNMLDLFVRYLLQYIHAERNSIYIGDYQMQINQETKTFKLLNALQAGERVSASQASKRFGIKNISAEVSRIRQAGYAVYANKRVAGNHVEVTEYRLGTPSRKLIAAGYKAMALGLA